MSIYRRAYRSLWVAIPTAALGCSVAYAQALSTEQTLADFSTHLNKGELQLGVVGRGASGGCTVWGPRGHGNWNVVQSCQANNPTEWQVYTNAAAGTVRVIGGTNQVILEGGTQFSTVWSGLPYFYYEGKQYKVAGVTDASHLTVQTTAGGKVTWNGSGSGTYYFVNTSATATCNVNGMSVSLVSGQPFIPFIDFFYINGKAYTVAAYNSQTSLTLSSSAGTLTNASCVTYKNINNELSVMRLQGLYGSSEENFAITETPAAAIIQTTYAGKGRYRPILLQNGEDPVGTPQVFLSLRPNPTVGQAGALGIGGDTDLGNQVIEVQPNPNSVNYWLARGAPTGIAPSLACRGTDSTVGCGIDVQGANTMSFTSHSFGNVEFQIFGAGGNSWLGAGSSPSNSPALKANGAASNINIVVQPKGNGVVQTTGPVQLPAYTVATLPTCSATLQYSMAVVTDASSPTYNGALAAGGSAKIPVFCNGSKWTAH